MSMLVLGYTHHVDATAHTKFTTVGKPVGKVPKGTPRQGVSTACLTKKNNKLYN